MGFDRRCESSGFVAGRVGFEPTICGSAGRRLGPGSTTGPEPGILVSPYNEFNRRRNVTSVFWPFSTGVNFICRTESGLV